MSDDDAPLLADDVDVAVAPNEAADPPHMLGRYIPADIAYRYEIHSYRNAALILSEAHPAEFGELMDALRNFSITKNIIRKSGGNESEVPKLVSAQLRPKGWNETIIHADLLIKLGWRESQLSKTGKSKTVARSSERIKARYLDGHKIDYVKGAVAFDLEWNSKDQTFDRDLYAFGAFNQCGVIDVGVLLTRSKAMNPVFAALGFALDKHGRETSTTVAAKYGASTTWMGKLLYRLNAGRNGSCPVLAIGIKPECVSDWGAGDGL